MNLSLSLVPIQLRLPQKKAGYFLLNRNMIRQSIILCLYLFKNIKANFIGRWIHSLIAIMTFCLKFSEITLRMHFMISHFIINHTAGRAVTLTAPQIVL